MKKIFAPVLLTVLFTVLISGCVSVNFQPSILAGATVAGRGEPESYTFDVGEITEIRVMIFCDVELYAAPSNTVTLEIQPNLIDYITVEETNGLLTVRSITSNFDWSSGARTPKLTVSTPSLSSVSLLGAGTLTAHDTLAADSFVLIQTGANSGTANLDVRSLTVITEGAGNLKFSGTADEADFRVAGAVHIEALELQTREISLNLSGVASVKISCSESLRVIDSGGVGSVEYRGSPAVEVSGSGLLSVRNVD